MRRCDVHIKELIGDSDFNKFVEKYYDNHIEEGCDGIECCHVRIWGVIDRSGDIVGGVVVQEDPIRHLAKMYKIDAEILMLYIDEEYRSIGVGGALVDIVLKRYENVSLITNKLSSVMARVLYEKNGFSLIYDDASKSEEYWMRKVD